MKYFLLLFLIGCNGHCYKTENSTERIYAIVKGEIHYLYNYNGHSEWLPAFSNKSITATVSCPKTVVSKIALDSLKITTWDIIAENCNKAKKLGSWRDEEICSVVGVK